jgi:hypothetical protein
VEPENESGEETVVDWAAPPESVERSVFGSVEMIKAEVEAVVNEPYVVDAYVAKVDEAMREYGVVPVNQMGVVVAFTSVPPYWRGVHGKAKVEAPSAERDDAPMAPVAETVAMLLVALPMPETTRAEVEAYAVVMPVVDAYVKTDEVAVEVPWKYGAAICRHASSPAKKVEVPVPEMARFLVVVGASAVWEKALVVTFQSRMRSYEVVESRELKEVQSAEERKPGSEALAFCPLV